MEDRLISLKAAIDALGEEPMVWTDSDYEIAQRNQWRMDKLAIETLPSAQPEGIPLEWINKHLEWLDNCGNDFAQLAKISIRAMVELWKKDRI